MKKYGRYITAYFTAFVISLIGIALNLMIPSTVIFVVFGVLSFIPVLAFIINCALAKTNVAKINRAKYVDIQGYLLRHRSEAAETSQKLLKKLQRLRRETTVYAIFIWVLACCASLFGGVLYTISSWALYPMIFYAGTIFCVIYARIPQKEKIELNKDALILKKEEFPYIYSIANRAAQTFDCEGEITILFSFDCNAGIVRDGNKYYMQFGIVLLSMLSEEELYCICLHEFSHCSKKHREIDYENLYSNWISSSKKLQGFMTFADNLFAAWDERYLFNYMTYQYATSVVKETEADSDMAKHSKPAIAASALLKTNYYEFFEWESGVKNEPSSYANETPNPNYLKEYIDKFKTVMEIRSNDWDEMLKNEIIANSASHPTFKMRLETLGVQQVEKIEYKSSPDYQKEIQNVLALADKKLFENKDLYEQSRKEYYVEPLKRITEWEEKGKPVLAENYADVISDLRQLGRNEEAEALCDRAIQELDVNSSQHAYYIKGCAMIHRYDKNGVEYIYHAIENNNNYLDEGLHEVGTFFCKTGMEKELLDYRQRVQELAQKDKDEFRETGFLSPKDNLSRDDMPASMLQEILTYIRSVDEDIIQNIYLVRKTITETFFTSAFVIHFYGGTDAQRGEIMHKIFRYLDTYPVKWQFSLFDYFDYPNIKFKKIKGSLVYSKSDSKGDKQ